MAQQIAKKEDSWSGVVKQGPYGAQQEGINWSFLPETKCSRITQVMIKATDVIHSIELTKIKPVPGGEWTAIHEEIGGKYGDQTKTIKLQPGEYVTHISGETGDYYREHVVVKLNIHTNMFPNGHGIIGTGNKCTNLAKFQSPILPDSQVVGFFGTHDGGFIRSIGVYTKKRDTLRAGPYGSQTQSSERWEAILPVPQSLKEVIINHGTVVDAIQFVIDGRTTEKYGGYQGGEDKIILKPGEYITHISGTYGEFDCTCNNIVIATLKIHTNLKKDGYGPFGKGKVKDSKSFSSPATGGRVVGLFGTYQNYLESIGVEIDKKCAP